MSRTLMTRRWCRPVRLDQYVNHDSQNIFEARLVFKARLVFEENEIWYKNISMLFLFPVTINLLLSCLVMFSVHGLYTAV